MYDPIHQFAVKTIIPLNIGGIDCSITNSSLFMLIVCACICGGLHFFTNKIDIIPSQRQVVAEKIFLFLKGLVRTYIGEKEMSYLPLIMTIFSFIATANILGLIPHAFTVTSQIIVTLTMSCAVVLFSIFVGIRKYGFKFIHFFNPKGVPSYVKIVLIPIEIMSFLFRPISLGVRLFANMVAGHVILKVFAIFATLFSGMLLPFALIPCLINCLFMVFELGVCFLQAYVFALLSCIYIHDTLNLH